VGILGGILAFYILLWMQRYRRLFRLRHGIKAEAKIEKILRSYGYRVVGIQRPIEKKMSIDGIEHTYQVRPDAMAERAGKVFFVEAKTGSRAPSPFFSHTRRQLLEYYYGENVDGIILLNADEGTIQQIIFPGGRVVTINNRMLLLLSFLMGVLLTAVGFYVRKNL